MEVLNLYYACQTKRLEYIATPKADIATPK